MMVGWHKGKEELYERKCFVRGIRKIPFFWQVISAVQK